MDYKTWQNRKYQVLEGELPEVNPVWTVKHHAGRVHATWDHPESGRRTTCCGSPVDDRFTPVDDAIHPKLAIVGCKHCASQLERDVATVERFREHVEQLPHSPYHGRSF